MRDLYLTIDDTPTPFSRELGDMLLAHDAPALFFVRGARMVDNVQPVADLIARGFVMGNHLFHHKRSSTIPLDEIIREITDTEAQIDAAYRMAGVERPAKYIRFPHIDRGTGGWVIDFDAVDTAQRETLVRLFADGLNVTMDKPDAAAFEKKAQLQDWLRAEGFTAPAFPGVHYEWYRGGEMGAAIDALFTFSTSDWMLTDRHRGKHDYKTIDDLCRKIDEDAFLNDSRSADIVLLHDDPENLLDVTKGILGHFQSQGFRFETGW